MATIALASDHAGVALKEILKEHLLMKKWDVLDLGTQQNESVDYPDVANKLAVALLNGHACWGILICGSGIGVSIAANRYPGIRAALAYQAEHARLARAHNNANVLCLGARFVDPQETIAWTELFLATEFEGGRHKRRTDKLG